MTPQHASPSSRSGRATGCRTSASGGDRRQDRVRQPPERRAPAGHRGVGVRQPEVGAADGRCRGRVRRHRRGAPGTRYTALVPNLAGLDRAHRRRRHRDRGLRGRRPRPSAARTSTRASTNRSPTYAQVCDARARRRAARPRLSLDRVRLSVRRRRVAPSASPTSPARLVDAGRLRGRDQRHHRHRASGPGAARARRACWRACPADQRRAALSRHARHGARQRAGVAALRHRDLRRRQPAGSAAVRARRAPPATWPPTI